jgi:hypothetical protein
MKLVQCVAAVSALVGAVSGASLREVMRADMAAELEATGTSKNTKNSILHKNCKNDNTKTEDRMCEPSEDNNGKANCNDCVQSCHVWGDPHMVTFDSECAVSVFFTPGQYIFWGQQNKEANQEFIIWAEVGKKDSDIGNKPWVLKAYIQDSSRLDMFPDERTLVADANDCTKKGETLFTDKKKMWSDSAWAKRAAGDGDSVKDVDVVTMIKCRKKHGPWQLEIYTEVHDEKSPVSQKLSKLDVFPYHTSTTFFWSDFGACVNPYSFGDKPFEGEIDPSNLPVDEEQNRALRAAEECQRTSTMGSQAGRVCKCSMECALWGDPHVKTFWKKSSRTASRSFQMPKASTGALTDEMSFVYQMQNRFAVRVEVDDCELINTVTVYAMKESVQKQMNGCNNKALTTEWLNSNDFKKFRFVADEECQDKTDTGANGRGKRKTIVWPTSDDDSKEFYNEELGGMFLGRSVVTNAGRLVPIPLDMNPNKVQQCATSALSAAGVSTASGEDLVRFDVDMGTAKIVLKCHNRAGQKSLRPYFNLCVNRDNIEPKAFAGYVPTANQEKHILNNIEFQSRNSGWCTTGDFEQGSSQASIQAASFTNRKEPGTAQPFVLATQDPISSS